MFEGRRVLVVVPARGGSQGVKLKNLREVGGVPLVGRAGDVVKALDFVDRAIVSTDHPEIARVAKVHGLDAPFMRPEDIVGRDHQRLAGSDPCACAKWRGIDGVTYDIVVMLQPTSPSRTPEHVTRNRRATGRQAISTRCGR